MERVIGIEPTSLAWEANALAVVLYPHKDTKPQINAIAPMHNLSHPTVSGLSLVAIKVAHFVSITTPLWKPSR